MASTSRYYTDAIHGLSQTIEKRLNVHLYSSLLFHYISQQQAHQSVVQRQPVRYHSNCFSRRYELCQILQNIEIIFQRLRNVKVDTSFSNAKTGDTLFDFIDSETVYSIQQDAICRIKE
ncbi:unnamed protein product [Albugo candida]|uniref:Uncharacterized protein n=1 Tax=Albugo candida TaxID=65357 RepID=A0A024GU28_9STRA|nr:unnamed protein product [Albugo candida]|eukprot:CCI50090.1 unnamed protein product [Albugo candida]